MSTIGVDVGLVGEVDVAAGQQRLGGLQGERLIAFEDQQVVGVQGTGDQPGGLLRGVEGIQG
ncbi:hypothetical protein [Paractinoplanes hotanensis]|uniref:Uncharacterized protein n=1 Tax=Paractinoplanes hotanensis TaxID=2906497 RepID=A0ABT0YC17_9ACTN|nr:hypothetical protein [Actinoplanes hotanensis]MCM4083591.1 hypothetical protein [Actinoplanes hotanensis]